MRISDGDAASGLRVLGRIRLSRVTEESTSVERQRELIQQWADSNDHAIVGWAEDLDVSGGVDPFDTPGLGPWLTDQEKIHQWDILCSWKLDRISRRAIPMHKVFGWLQENEKTLVCVSDNIDLSNWVGRMVASVIAGVAEGELEAIRERTRGSQKKLRETGRWGGGKPYYGYKSQKRKDGDGHELVPDEHASQVLMSIIDKVLAGRSTESIAKELNTAGELPPSDYIRHRAGKPTKGTKWSNATIRQLLKSETLLGYATHNGKTLRDEDGLPIRKAPELISREKFDRLQTALGARSFKVSNRSENVSPMLGVAICAVCKKPMHLRQHHSKARGKTYRYYQCTGGATSGGGGELLPKHGTNIAKADEVEELAEQQFLWWYGHEQIEEPYYVPGDNHEEQLADAKRAAQEIALMLGSATSDTMRKFYQSQLEAIDRRMAALEKLPVSQGGWKVRKLQQTYADAWAAADTEGRRQLLLKRRVSVEVSAIKNEIGVRVPEYRLFAMDVTDPQAAIRANNEGDPLAQRDGESDGDYFARLNLAAQEETAQRIAEFAARPDDPDNGSEITWTRRI